MMPCDPRAVNKSDDYWLRTALHLEFPRVASTLSINKEYREPSHDYVIGGYYIPSARLEDHAYNPLQKSGEQWPEVLKTSA